MSASALSTDLYELTMLAGYHKAGLAPRATFDLFVRALPPTRKYLLAAGLDQALDFLSNLRFTADEIRYLREVPALRHLDASFFDECLPSFRFRGDVWAMEEGTPAVPPHGRQRYMLTPNPAGTRWIHTHQMAGPDLHRGTYTGQFG